VHVLSLKSQRAHRALKGVDPGGGKDVDLGRRLPGGWP